MVPIPGEEGDRRHLLLFKHRAEANYETSYSRMAMRVGCFTTSLRLRLTPRAQHTVSPYIRMECAVERAIAYQGLEPILPRRKVKATAPLLTCMQPHPASLSAGGSLVNAHLMNE